MGVNRCRAGTALIDRPRIGARLAVFALLMVSILGFVSVAQVQPAWAVSGDAQQLLNLINQERAAVGAQPLSFRDDLVLVAAEHSSWMASTGIFQHRSDLSEGVTGPWSRIGENIAYGWSVSNIHRMFMESKGHCENNLYSGFNRVGIEFATGGNGAMYVTVVFVQESGASHPKPTVCPYDYSSTTTTAPPATTTTTAPPATTTTTAPPATTTTTAPPATTTTTAPPATTTTTAPPATTTTTAATTTTTVATGEVVLPLASTTTTTSVATTIQPVEAVAGDNSTAPAGENPVTAAGPATDSNNAQGGFPAAALAGAATALAAAGGWWLLSSRRGAPTAVKSPWEIPHTGVRPPQ